jgi:starch phosphorylase
MTVETTDGQHLFKVQVDLGELAPDFVCVELYANGLPNGSSERHVMARDDASDPRNQLYTLRVPAARPPNDYTPRLIPYNPEAIIPLEATQISWQR